MGGSKLRLAAGQGEEPAMNKHVPRKYFVTRHNGAVTWARESGVKARKVEMQNFDVNVVGPRDVVMGTLPVHLVAEVCARGGEYWHLAMDIPPEARGRELSADDMRDFGARLEAFHVQNLGARLSTTPDVPDESAPSGRPALHVCIVTGQIMANLLPLRHQTWSAVALIVSKAMGANARHLEQLVRREIARPVRELPAHTPIVHKELKHTTPLAAVAADMERIARELRAQFPGHDVVVNWTGGDKLMAQAVLEAFRPFARLFYCHTDSEQLEAIWPRDGGMLPLPEQLTDVETYLLAHGYRITGQRPQDEAAMRALRARHRLTASLLLHGNQFRYARAAGGWAMLVRNLHWAANQARPEERRGKKPPRPFTPRVSVEDVGNLPPQERRLLDALVDHGVLMRWEFTGSAIELEFPSVEMAEYLSGGYVEEFVVLSLLGAGLPAGHVAFNVRVDVLDPLAGRRRDDLNELDAVVVWRNRLLIIECKAGVQLQQEGTSQQMLYKLAALRNLVGPFGSAWMVSREPLSAQANADVVDRMRSYQLRAIAGPAELPDLEAAVRSWARLPDSQGGPDWRAAVLPLLGAPPPAPPNPQARPPAPPGQQAQPPAPPSHRARPPAQPDHRARPPAPPNYQARPARPESAPRTGGKHAGRGRPRPRPPDRPAKGMPRDEDAGN